MPVVVTAAQAEDPRDPAVLASSLPNDIVLSLTSETVGVPAVIKAAAGATSLLTDAVLSLSSATVGVPAVVDVATGAASLGVVAVVGDCGGGCVTVTAAAVATSLSATETWLSLL